MGGNRQKHVFRNDSTIKNVPSGKSGGAYKPARRDLENSIRSYGGERMLMVYLLLISYNFSNHNLNPWLLGML